MPRKSGSGRPLDQLQIVATQTFRSETDTDPHTRDPPCDEALRKHPNRHESNSLSIGWLFGHTSCSSEPVATRRPRVSAPRTRVLEHLEPREGEDFLGNSHARPPSHPWWSVRSLKPRLRSRPALACHPVGPPTRRIHLASPPALRSPALAVAAGHRGRAFPVQLMESHADHNKHPGRPQ